MTEHELGDLVPDDEYVALRFTRRYPHPPSKVWRAVTEPEHQAVWFPQQILGQRRPGAPLRFVTSVDPDDGFDGRMIAYDPPRLLEMMWGESRLRIELEPDGDGTCLRLTEWLDDVGKGARNGAGWHECLDRLAAIVSSATPLRWGVRWRQIHPFYVERFGPDADRLKAPDNWDDGLPYDPYAPRFPQYPNPTDPLTRRTE